MKATVTSRLTCGPDSAAHVVLLAAISWGTKEGTQGQRFRRPRVPDAAGEESASTHQATQGQDMPTTLSPELALESLGGRKTPGKWKSQGSPRWEEGPAPPMLPPVPVHTGRLTVHMATLPSGLRCAHTPSPAGSVAAPVGRRNRGTERNQGPLSSEMAPLTPPDPEALGGQGAFIVLDPEASQSQRLAGPETTQMPIDR